MVDGVVVPGGFGTRGIEGKIIAAKYCRENKIPYLGVCLGMQVMVMEYARTFLKIADATSEEFSKEAGRIEDEKNVVVFMPEGSKSKMGGTMRLGARETVIKADTMANRVYAGNSNGTRVSERHRHRYEVSPAHIDRLEAKGLIFSGRDTTGERMEIVELADSDHPFYFGAQFHPEFKSRPTRPSPPFYCLVAAASGIDTKSPEF